MFLVGGTSPVFLYERCRKIKSHRFNWLRKQVYEENRGATLGQLLEN